MKKENRAGRRRRIIERFDAMSAYYGGELIGMEEVNRREAAKIAARFEGRILEVGCGPGDLIDKYYDASRHRLTVLDFSEAMLVRAKRRFVGIEGIEGIQFVRGDALSLPFAANSFDAVVSINTLHNLPSKKEIAGAFGEFARVLKPGGALLFDFRNAANPFRLWVSLCHDADSLPQRVLLYSWVKSTLESAGFSGIERIAVQDEHYAEYVPVRSRMPALSVAVRKTFDRSPFLSARLLIKSKKRQ